MKNTVLYFLLMALWGFSPFASAQIEALTSDITVRNGVAYYNGQPFSGTLYSDDDEIVPNDCECTLIATYRNGLLHGEKREYHPNGKLKFVGRYEDGIPVGVHIYYLPNGAITEKIWYENGRPVKKEEYGSGGVVLLREIYENGELKEAHTFYSDGTKQTSEFKSPDGKRIFIKYYENGNPCCKEEYLNGNSHGEWIRYYASGQKKDYERYEQNQLIEKGSFDENGEKHGKWEKYNADGTVTVTLYEHGEIKSTQEVNPQYSVSNFQFYSDDVLGKYYNAARNTDEYIVFRSDESGYKDRPSRRIARKITDKLTQRAKRVNPELIKDKNATISKILQIENIRYNTEPFEYEVTQKDKNGNVQKVKKIAYRADIYYDITAYGPDGSELDKDEYEIKSDKADMGQLLRSILKYYPPTPEDALTKAIENIHTQWTHVGHLPYYISVSRITKSSGSKAKTVSYTTRYPVQKKMKFGYIPKGEYRPTVILKITNAYGDYGEAKVIKGGEWIKQHENELNNIYFKETY